MSSRLENLNEDLYNLFCSTWPRLWDQVHAAGGHNKLQTLGIYFLEVDETELEAMLWVLERDFPALITLELSILGLKRHSPHGQLDNSPAVI